jgi:type IV pilus assembly protein PilV
MVSSISLHKYSTAQTVRRQAGFSIVEVLIALVILSLGMLGAVGMQAAAMKSNKETRNQSVAASFARELADKMRSNPDIARKTTVAENPYLIDTTLVGTATFSAPAENCFTNGCSSISTIATWDMADWQNRIRNALPDPKIKVCFDQTPFDAAGKPQWDCSDDGNISVLKIAWTSTNTAGTLSFTSGDILPQVVLPLSAGVPN